MKDFFQKTHCDRCGKKLQIRTMSIFNKDCICLKCKEKEKLLPNYKEAVEKDNEEIRKGNFNFKGIGLEKHKRRK